MLESRVATSSVNACMLIEIREDTTFNTAQFSNPCLASLCTRLCWHSKWRKLGWAQCVKPMETGSALHWHEGRHCTSTEDGIAQAQGATLHRHGSSVFCKLCPPVAVHRAMPAAFARPLPCNICFETFQALQFPLLVVSITPPCYTWEEGQPIPRKI